VPENGKIQEVDMRNMLLFVVMLFVGSGLYARQGNGGEKVVKTPCTGESSVASRIGEFLIDTSVVYGPASSTQEYPAVAFDGTNYLVVWEERRSDPNWGDIWGARVSPSGTVLDTSGILISTAVNSQWSPAVAFDGINYLVVWQDKRNGNNFDIYGARVNPSGTVLDPSGIPISTAANGQWYPAVAFDGVNYLVVWEDFRSNGIYRDIYGARVSPSGTVLDPSGIAISTAASNQELHSVAFDGTNYLVVWDDYRSGSNYDIYGARVSPSGSVLDPSGIPISTAAYDQGSPSVAFDGTNCLVVWSSYVAGGTQDIYGARVSPSGTVLDPSGIPISTAANSQNSPSVAFDGTNYLVVWMSYYISTTNADLYGARVSPSGTVLDPSGIAISTAANGQWYPSVAFGGTNYLAVWMDWRNGGSLDIYGARVSPSGTVLDPSGIAISIGINTQYAPSVAFDGTNYLVVWMDSRNDSYYDIYGARVDPSGQILDSIIIPISTAVNKQWLPSVAFDGTNYLVVWEDYRGNGTNPDIYGARVSPSGTVLDPSGIAISAATNWQEYPSVAFDGTNYLVVWMDYPNPSIPHYDIYGARVSTDGVVVDSFAVSTQPGDQIGPKLAHGTQDQIFVVYSGWTDSINNHPANTMRIWGKSYPFIGIRETALRTTPNALHLKVYPNPFSEKTEIRYKIHDTRYTIQDVGQTFRFAIYDATGRLVRDFSRLTVNGEQSTILWDGTDNSGHKLPSGVYFVRLEAGEFKKNEKVILLR